MTERPILFSAPMVRAILTGAKTQTRRVLRDQSPIDLGAFAHGGHLSRRPVSDRVAQAVVGQRVVPVHCPYGQPGDRLWVREAWMPVAHDTQPYRYRATNPSYAGKWRPSIHMPRVASRITLEIVSVRVEWLQDISEADAKAEGCEPGLTKVEKCHGWTPYVLGYSLLWESINGPGSWEVNPWVWVVEFKRVAL